MSDQDMLRIAEDNLNAFNAGDWERMKATLAPDSVYDELATQRRVEGADKIIEVNQSWKQAFPDAHGTLTSSQAAGNVVIQEITWAGTNRGPMETPTGMMPATGRPVSIRAAMISTFDGDRIKETHHYFDMMSMLDQLGVMSQQRAA
jgi:steroid delta-isomerase-like uncharacterized protein